MNNPQPDIRIHPAQLLSHAKTLEPLVERFAKALDAAGQVVDPMAFGLIGQACGLGAICGVAQTLGSDSLGHAKTVAQDQIDRVRTWSQHVDWREQDVKSYLDGIQID
ncbi:hypothetical protein ACGFMK_09630 [Amycolatopsis sp. NPDC049252]|uniref:hypothetical protein n=1 Tax=Amycolatopsis sp. NPDC049252 TaxID=3363933 RepID=UPI00372239A5